MLHCVWCVCPVISHTSCNTRCNPFYLLGPGSERFWITVYYCFDQVKLSVSWTDVAATNITVEICTVNALLSYIWAFLIVAVIQPFISQTSYSQPQKHWPFVMKVKGLCRWRGADYWGMVGQVRCGACTSLAWHYHLGVHIHPPVPVTLSWHTQCKCHLSW